MNEIPNLKIGIPEADIKQWAKDPNRLWYSIEQIKEVIAFYEKYKDKAYLLCQDFPQYDKEIREILNKLEKTYSFDSVARAEFTSWYKDWLFNKLFKEGIV